MTIEFNCPKCNAVIGFADKHAGKQAHCTACEQKFIIPGKSFEKAQKIQPPKEEKGEPIQGFYQAVLTDSYKIFLNPKNITGLVFIVTGVVIKFFTAAWNFNIRVQGRGGPMNFYMPLGWILRAEVWGFLFWYYSEMIYSTGFDEENFPEIILGGFYGLLGKIVKSLYTLFVVLLVVWLPFIITYLISKKTGAELPILMSVFMYCGIFLLPIAVLNVAVGRDLTLLRPDYFLTTIFRAFIPYLIPAILLGTAVILQIKARQFSYTDSSGTIYYLLLNVAIQMLFVIAMRSIGLFYRHYSCHLPW